VKKGDKIKEKQVIARAKDSKKTLKSTMNGVVTEAKDGIIKIKSIGKVEHVYNVPGGKTLKVANGDSVQKGDALTSGHINLRDLMALTDVYTAQKYIIGQVQTIYTSQGQSIHDKHIEIIARQMLSKIRVIEPGGTNLLPGQISNIIQWENINKAIKSKVPSRSERLLLGLTRIALYTDSWLSAASFQETIRVLVEASTTKTVDHLDGLKENVIIGKLIPAGETYRKRNPEAMK
jgi:DNA-directed RNA polymerase subunit beta'